MMQLSAEVHGPAGPPDRGCSRGLVERRHQRRDGRYERPGDGNSERDRNRQGTLRRAVSDSASIVVSQTAATVEITPTTHTLADRRHRAADLRRRPTTTDTWSSDAAFTWTSSDTAVASVDSLGLVRGLAEGTATITAGGGGSAAAGVEGTAEITVLPPPPPPDLTGTYFLESLVGTSTGGTRLTRPTVWGTLELTQEAPSGDSAMGSYEVDITTPDPDDHGRRHVHRANRRKLAADGAGVRRRHVRDIGRYAHACDHGT